MYKPGEKPVEKPKDNAKVETSEEGMDAQTEETTP